MSNKHPDIIYSALLIFSFEATMWKFAGETHKMNHNLPEIED